MARQAISAQAAAVGGITPVYATPTVDGFLFPVDGDNLELRVKNGNAASCVVTLQVPRTILGNAAPNFTVTIPTTQERRIKIDPALMKRPIGGTDEGMVYVDFSVFTSVTVALESR